LINVSEVLTASIIRVINALMMEAASSPENLPIYMRLHGATSQKTVIFILAAMRT
jgi:hypothetical protein